MIEITKNFANKSSTVLYIYDVFINDAGRPMTSS